MYGNDLPSIEIVVVASCITSIVVASDGNDDQSEMNDFRMDL